MSRISSASSPALWCSTALRDARARYTRDRKWESERGSAWEKMHPRWQDNFDELCASHANEFANDVNDEDMQAFLSQMERPIHRALRSGKILCPKDTCVERMGFF